ncbi:MAG: hypothetical protein ACT4PT_03005 [Methanobacteriota archaeon]
MFSLKAIPTIVATALFVATAFSAAAQVAEPADAPADGGTGGSPPPSPAPAVEASATVVVGVPVPPGFVPAAEHYAPPHGNFTTPPHPYPPPNHTAPGGYGYGHRPYEGERREEKPPCEFRADGVARCRPPPHCEGRIGGDGCVPPPDCKANGDGTFDCRSARESDRREYGKERRDGRDYEPACEPVGEGAVRCKPPPACAGRVGTAPDCIPPRECSDNGDGTFTCKFDGNELGGKSSGRRYETPGRRYEEEPGPCRPTRTATCGPPPEVAARHDEARAEVRAVVRDAMADFRRDLADVKADYRDGLAAIKADYDAEKKTSRASYETCLASAKAEADERAARSACRDVARAELRSYREKAAKERQELREGVLAETRALKEDTCEALADEIEGILASYDVADARALGGPGDFGVCAEDFGGDFGHPTASGGFQG